MSDGTTDEGLEKHSMCVVAGTMKGGGAFVTLVPVECVGTETGHIDLPPNTPLFTPKQAMALGQQLIDMGVSLMAEQAVPGPGSVQ